MFRSLSALALAAAVAPFVFFTLAILMALGITAFTFMPLVLTFVAWIVLGKWARRAEREAAREPLIEAKIVRDDTPASPPEAYSPPAHFDLLLSAKHDIGRIRGAAGAIADAGIARQFRALAERSDVIHARLTAEPVKLGLARRFFASYLPRAADLAEGYHRLVDDSAKEGRRAKLLDVLYRLEMAMKEEEKGLDAPELSRIDADIRILTADLKGFTPDFTKAPEPILNRGEEIVRSAKPRG